MTMRRIYVLLCAAGIVLPYWQFAPWLVQHGPDLRLLIQQLFANRVSGFFALDVLVSALVVFVFALSERRRLRLWWAPIVAVLTVGVSLALPLLLYLREGRAHPLADAKAAR
jgi:Terpene cyclase DEP1